MTPMTWIIILAALVMLALAIVMTWILGWANRAFAVEVDPRIDQVNEALPGANCGGCGYVGCGEYAEAVVLNDESITLCPVGGEACAQQIAAILGVEVEESYPYRPAVHCAACESEKLGKHEYRGEQRCSTANLVNGIMGCTYGCLGFGDCVTSCRFDAMKIVNGKVEIDYDKCVGCGACEKACPRHIISMVPFKTSEMYVVACSNGDFGKDVKAVCKVGCMGCKACTRVSDGLFQMKGNMAHIDYDKYEPGEVSETMNVVLDKCPMKAIVKLGKPSKEDLDKVKDETMPEVVPAEFETTVDKTEWQG